MTSMMSEVCTLKRVI